MPKPPIIRGPDLDSAKRDTNTGRHLDVPRSQGAPRRPNGRMSTIRSATSKRRMSG